MSIAEQETKRRRRERQRRFTERLISLDKRLEQLKGTK